MMISRFCSISILALTASIVLTALSTVSAEARSCSTDFKKSYLEQAAHKAFATEDGAKPSGRVACGFAARYATKSGAIVEALRICTKNASHYSPRHKCKVYRSK